MPLDSIDDAIADISDGKCIIVVDDEDRENEGDLVAAGARVTRETMAFIIKAGGLVCAPITVSEARRLKLEPMARENDAPLATAFTVSIDYREGLTTGISAEERAASVRALANNNVQADDFVRPGHIFPLIAKDGGVLIRSGHTEAAVDLARLAGLPPVGVICEILGDDGATLKGDGLLSYARQHDLKVVSIADLIAYRQQRETLVEAQERRPVATRFGPAEAIRYTTPFDDERHLVLVFGDVSGGEDVLVRLHREDPLGDVFGGGDGSLEQSLARIAQERRGVVVYLREGAVGVSNAPIEGEGTESAASRFDHWLDVGLGAQILRDLGLKSIRLLASRERQYVGLSGFDIEITETVLIE